MADFPLLVLEKIFSFLNIQGKLRAKIVCKNWKSVLDMMRSQQNACIHYLDYPYKRCWPFSSQRVADQDMICLQFNRENERKFDLKMQFFQNLQKLYLHRIGDPVKAFLKGEINCLAKLKVLMIEERRISCVKLALTGLQQLSLKCDSLWSIELNTPNLRSLTIWTEETEVDRLIFHFPLKIKELECNFFDLNLSALENLETLICQEMDVPFDLNQFKSLTRLEFFPRQTKYLSAAKLIREAGESLKRDRLEMIVYGFKEEPIICKTHSKYHFTMSPEYLDYVLKNYSDLVGHIPWEFQVAASTLLKHCASIPADFFNRFTIAAIWEQSFEQITSSDGPNLIELIKRSKAENVDLFGFELKKEFYKQLPVQSIKFLTIGPLLADVEFDHFLKLKNLREINIFYRLIQIKFISRLFKELTFFVKFFFQAPGKMHIRIEFEKKRFFLKM